MRIRNFDLALVLGALLVLGVSTASAQEQLAPRRSEAAATSNALTRTITIGDRPLWRKVVRGIARVATLGVVQASSDSIRKDTPFSVEANHDGIDTSSYNILLNTALQGAQPFSALVNGIVSFNFPTGLPKGSYMVIVKALGPGGETSSPSLALSVTAGNPSAPGQPRIIKGL